jgi:hypothetical protein
MRALIPPMLVAWVGCLDGEAGPGVKGDPADFTTSPGEYPGYRVVRPCWEGVREVGVSGLGSIVLEDVAELAAAGQDLLLSLQDVDSVWGGGGYGLGCEPGVGTTVSLDDWRDVDEVVARTGAFLEQRDLSLQVGISVQSIPVAH